MAQCALITGATSGFGKATAEKLAQEGWDLILVGRRVARLKELSDKLSARVNVHYAPLDVRDTKAIHAFVNDIPDAFKHVSVLVNNAGLALGIEPADKAKLDDWQTMIDTNITGLATMTHAMTPILLNNTPASIVNISSISANWPYPGGNVYGATKAFVSQFSRNLRSDFVGRGVRVTSLEPGLAETEFSVVRFNGDQQRADDFYKGMMPLIGEDIANAVHWIITQPAHININTMEIMPECQAWGPFHLIKDAKV